MDDRQDIIKKPKHSFKTKSRYRLSFIDENRFNEVWTIKFTRAEIIIATVLLIAALSCLVATIIVLSPIRTLLPGYLKEAQRQENIANSMRIDSLVTRVSINNAYMANLETLLSNPTDTVPVYVAPEQWEPLPPDSLMPASENEKRFVRQFEENEKFNVNILSPIAADGISFFPPVSHGTEPESDSGGKSYICIVTPPEETVCAINEGTVIDCHSVMSRGNSITIQHPNGFVSKYSGLHTPFVAKGDKVERGSVIGIMPAKDSAKEMTLTFELWNKGVALNPRDYIAF